MKPSAKFYDLPDCRCLFYSTINSLGTLFLRSMSGSGRREDITILDHVYTIATYKLHDGSHVCSGPS